MFCTMCSFKAQDVWECGGCKERSCRHIRLIDHARICPVPAIASKETAS